VTSRKLLPPVLLLAFVVRVWGLGFGLPYSGSRVDETAIAGPAVQFLSGTLRPPDFLYPTGFRYAVALVYAGWYAVNRPFGTYDSLAAFAESRRQSLAPFFYLSRGLSAIMGTLTVWWVFAIARRIFDDRVAIVGAFYTALAYLHVRDSHFGTLDISMTALVVLSVLLILRWQEAPTLWRASVAGLVGGLATSTKYNGLGVWIPFMVAVGQRALEKRSTEDFTFRQIFGAVGSFAGAFAIGFFGTSPYILLEWDRFTSALAVQSTTLAQGHGLALARGWWLYAGVTLPAALGWPLYLAGVTGTALLLFGRLRQAAVVLAFPIAYYAVAGSGYRVFARDILPVLPFLCIPAAWLTVTGVHAVLGTNRPRARAWATATVALLIVAPSARNVLLLDRLLTRPDNRLVVAKTLATVIPAGSLIYHSGESYGRVPFQLSDVALNFKECDYDEAANRFTPDGRLPAWIILQRSPLVLYSRVPDGVLAIARERYDLVRIFPVAADDPSRVYDQQDALFLPLTGLAGVERIGPTFEVYRLREAQ
jgi:hypothetical protein